MEWALDSNLLEKQTEHDADADRHSHMNGPGQIPGSDQYERGDHRSDQKRYNNTEKIPAHAQIGHQCHEQLDVSRPKASALPEGIKKQQGQDHRPDHRWDLLRRVCRQQPEAACQRSCGKEIVDPAALQIRRCSRCHEQQKRCPSAFGQWLHLLPPAGESDYK